MRRICGLCKNSGIVYEGTGHQMAGYPFAEKTTAVSCPNGCTGMSLSERRAAKEWRSLTRLKHPVNRCDHYHCTADFGVTARMDRAFEMICRKSPVLTNEGKLK